MTTTKQAPTGTIVREIDIKATVARIFAAITDPQQVTAWWGNGDTYRCERMEQDFRVGGAWRTVGHGKDGKPFAVEGEYRVIDPPHTLEYTWRHDWGTRTDEETLVRFELSDRGDGVTHLRVVHSGFADPNVSDDHADGWTRVLGWLRDYVQ
jgi:uncharacterized protein YndB with AHSA1/START domain